MLAPLRLAERGAMPVFGVKSKIQCPKETPPGTLDSAHVCADTHVGHGVGVRKRGEGEGDAAVVVVIVDLK